MKIASFIALCLLFAGFAYGECVEVTPVAQTSSSRIRVTAVVGNKPAPKATVDVYRSDLTPLSEMREYSLVSDENGAVTTPDLTLGTYRLSVTSADKAYVGELLISVAVGNKNQTSAFFVNLLSRLPSVHGFQALTKDDLLAAIAKMPNPTRLRQFNGTVLDPSGAVIGDADIVVVTAKTKEVVELKSATDGRFSASLPTGIYIAVFHMKAFRQEVVVFEITKDAPQDLRVTMQVASC